MGNSVNGDASPCFIFSIVSQEQKVRSEKVQNKKSPKFSNVRPEFCSEFRSEFFEDFSCFVSCETETTKNHQKSPPFFNAKSPGKLKAKFTKVFWRAVAR